MSDTADNFTRLADQARREGRFADARRDLLAAIDLLREKRNRDGLGRALRSLGEIERRLRLGDAARRRYEEAVAIFRDEGDGLRLAHTVRHLGDIHHDEGRAELAEPCYREALDLYRSHEGAPPLDLANAVRSMAVLKEEAGEVEQARELWEEARDLYAAVDVRDGVAESSARLARLAPRREVE